MTRRGWGGWTLALCLLLAACDAAGPAGGLVDEPAPEHEDEQAPPQPDDEPAFQAGGAPPRTVAAFVERLGVNVHFGMNKSPYVTRWDDVRDLLGTLADLGVRQIRDRTFKPNRDGSPHDVTLRHRALYEQHGIRTLLIFNDRVEGTPRYLDFDAIDDLAASVQEHYGAAALAVEGANEYNLLEGADPEWATTLWQHQQRIYDAIKGDARTADLPVVAPSLAGVKNMLQVRDFAPIADRGNGHLYVSWGDYPNRSLAQKVELLTERTGGQDVWATEFGWHTLTRLPDGVTEEQGAKNLLRYLVDLQLQGVERLYMYELVDIGTEDVVGDHWGLWRNDLTPKVAGQALLNLLTILRDDGVAVPAEPPAFDTDVRALWLDHSSGDAFLLLAPDDGQPVSVSFDAPVSGAFYRPVAGTAPVARFEARTTAALDTSGELVVLRIDR